MKRLTVFAIVGLLVATAAANAQDSIKSSLSVTAGLNSFGLKDRFQSPYTYRGTAVSINFLFKKNTVRGMYLIDGSFSGGSMKSIVSPEARYAVVQLGYDYLFDLNRKTTDKKIKPSLGLGLHTLLSNVNYLPDVESSAYSTTGSASLTLSGNVTYKLGKKNSIQVQGHMAFIGLVYRPDFEINGNTLTAVSYIGKGNLLGLSCQYRHAISSKIQLVASYRYSYFAFDRPRPVTVLQNGFSLGVVMALR